MASKTPAPAAKADTAPTGPPPDIAGLSFEDALKALEEIVRHLETGRVDLDAAVTAYERGVWLRKHCESRLAEARARVERISADQGGADQGGADPGGGPSASPLDVE
jgi:exodeoxyribonuclease VII small subunit